MRPRYRRESINIHLPGIAARKFFEFRSFRSILLVQSFRFSFGRARALLCDCCLLIQSLALRIVPFKSSSMFFRLIEIFFSLFWPSQKTHKLDNSADTHRLEDIQSVGTQKPLQTLFNLKAHIRLKWTSIRSGELPYFQRNVLSNSVDIQVIPDRHEVPNWNKSIQKINPSENSIQNVSFQNCPYWKYGGF